MSYKTGADVLETRLAELCDEMPALVAAAEALGRQSDVRALMRSHLWMVEAKRELAKVAKEEEQA